jgi:HK97 family phage portal protein
MFASALKRSWSTGNLTDPLNDFWYGVVTPPAFAGVSVTNTNAMQLWAVNACVTLISAAVAQLPLKLKRAMPNGGTEDAKEHRLYDLVKTQPNPDMISLNWRESGQGNLLCSGNQYSWIERANIGVKYIWPLEPKSVTPMKSGPRDRERVNLGPGERIYYRVRMDDGKLWDIPGRDILHVVGFGWNGLIGESVISNFARQSIGNGIALEQFQGAFFKNGVHTSGVFEHPETLGDNREAFVTALKEKYSGGGNTGVPMVLENGMLWKQNKVSLVDQQFLEQTKANALTICAMFHVPPSKIAIYGEGTSYNNTEQQNKNYLDDTLMHWLVRWEQTLDVKLLTPQERAKGYFFKHNVDALLRPDAKTRSEIGKNEWQMGVPLNVIRKRNDENPIDGGDVSYVPANFIPADMAGKQLLAKAAKEKT